MLGGPGPLPGRWGSIHDRPEGGGATRDKSFTLQCLLLPYLEQGDLYNAINIHLPGGSFGFFEQFQRTAATRRIAAFTCPSDPLAHAGRLAPVSYRACTGTGEMEEASGRLRFLHPGAFDYLNHGQEPLAVLPVSRIRDGLSNTLAFSEKPIGTPSGGAYHPFRDWAFVPSDDRTQSGDEWIRTCSGLTTVDPRFDAGGSWMIPGVIFTLFFATAPPNARVPDCGHEGDGGNGLFAIWSYHPGRVNAAMADGSVRSFTSGTAPAIWRGLASRDGGEVVPVE